jgi:hypothetical protein
MARANETRTAQGLQQVRRRIDVWRRTRLKRSPMPEELCARVTRLRIDCGIGVTSGYAGRSLSRLVRQIVRQTLPTALVNALRGRQSLQSALPAHLVFKRLWAIKTYLAGSGATETRQSPP